MVGCDALKPFYAGREVQIGPINLRDRKTNLSPDLQSAEFELGLKLDPDDKDWVYRRTYTLPAADPGAAAGSFYFPISAAASAAIPPAEYYFVIRWIVNGVAVVTFDGRIECLSNIS